MKHKRWFSLTVAMVVVFALLVGCSTTQTSDTSGTTGATTKATTAKTSTTSGETTTQALEPITFSLLMGAWKVWDEPMTADPVGQWIIEQTGVTIEPEIITGEASEKYSLILATKEFPDLMQWPGDDLASKYIDEDALVAYDEYLDMMPNVQSRYGDDIGALYNLDDGHLYRISQWSMGNSLSINTGLNIRHDIMVEYFGNRATEKSTILISELEDMFIDYKSKNPTNADGAVVFPLTSSGASSLLVHMGQAYGLYEYWEDSPTTVSIRYTHPNTVELIKDLNRWYNNGILDPEFAINKDENMWSKVSTDVSIAVWCHEASLQTVNDLLLESDPEKYMFSYYRVAKSEGSDRYVKYSAVGSGGLSVTKDCKDIERAMSWINFMNDAEVMFMLCNGVEDIYWRYNSEGKVEVIQEEIEKTPDLWERFRISGGYKYIWMLSEGIDSRFPAWPYDFYMPIHGEAGVQPRENIGRKTFWSADDDLVNPAYFQGIQPAAGTDEAIIFTEITDLWDSAWPQIIMAENEDAAIALYDSTMAQINDAGLQQYLDVLSPRYYQKKALME